MATKILLVEDDQSLREIYSVRLQAEGYTIIVASDGEQALAIAIKERPALIITDVMMPKISGFDMLDILRSTAETKSIKVIMMTALSSDDNRTRGENMGADRYLVKSQVGIEDVVRTVHEVLGDTGQGQPAAASTTLSTQTPPLQQPAQSVQTSTPATPPTSQSNISVQTSSKQRVIQPIDSSANKVDINELLDRELAKEAGLDMFSRPQVATAAQEQSVVQQQIQQVTQAPDPAAATPVQADHQQPVAQPDPSTQLPQTPPAVPQQPASRPAPTVPPRNGPLQAPPRKMIPTI